MEIHKKFKVIISEEVDKFLDNIPNKAKAKIFYNINLVVAGHVNKDLFKKIDGTDLLNSELYFQVLPIDYCHFSIRTSRH